LLASLVLAEYLDSLPTARDQNQTIGVHGRTGRRRGRDPSTQNPRHGARARRGAMLIPRATEGTPLSGIIFISGLLHGA